MSSRRNTSATQPQRSGGVPAYRALYERLRTGILTGQLQPGSRLPPSRSLALDYGLSRTTVLAAFEQLESEGYISGRPGSGTYVSETLPDIAPMMSGRSGSVATAQPGTGSSNALSKRGQMLVSAPRMPLPSLTRRSPLATAFQIGLPPLDCFPHREWQRISTALLREAGTDLMTYGHPAGLRALREEIAKQVGLTRGIHCLADQVIVTSGSQQALEFCARVLLDPGTPAWIEDPSYLGMRAAVVGSGARAVPVPVDDQGIDVAAGISREANARAAFVTPSHQFPLGVTMSLERRLALIKWAVSADAWIVEDDYDCEFRYQGQPLAALRTIDAHDRVVYIGTFSKTMFPALRLGYIVAPRPLIDGFIGAHLNTDIHSHLGDQSAVAEFLAEGGYARHVRRIRTVCRQRQRMVAERMRTAGQGYLRVEVPAGGLHLVGWLPNDVDDALVADRAGRAGVHVWPLSLHTVDVDLAPALLLGFAAVSDDDAHRAVQILVRVIEESRGTRDTPVEGALLKGAPGTSAREAAP